MLFPPPRLHTPWRQGVYDVAPNLRPLGDTRAFEFDSDWPLVRANKEQDTPGRVLRHDLDRTVAEAVVLSLASRLAHEWPTLFELGERLGCHLTGESVPLSADGLDAVAMNLPCDIAVVRREGERDWNAYLHVCAPSHWRPEEKIGHSFVSSHQPIPHFERISRAGKGLVHAMVERGPFVRFVWGVETDTELDHHPDRASERPFTSLPFVVRVERQVTIPLIEHDATIFLIGTSFVERATILKDETLWRPLRQALNGMSPQARAYKGIAEGFEALMAQFPP